MDPDFVKLRDIKPVLSAYVSEAHQLLEKARIPDDGAVHDVRVLMKKSRAVMKLIASQVDDDFFRKQYDTFREVGLKTRTWRDTSVHRKTLKDLKKKYPDVFSGLSAYNEINALLQKKESDAEPHPGMAGEVQTIRDLLSKTGYRIRFQTMNNLDPKVLINSLEQTYQIVTDKYLDSRNNLKSPKIHEFRKRAKDFLYQLYFFRPLNPSIIKSVEKKLDNLTRNLGKYNDLAQLIISLNYKYKSGSTNPALDELIVLIREEQDRCLSKVWPNARRIFNPGQRLINLLGFRILMI
jgi:CHAD domain-containing protein